MTPDQMNLAKKAIEERKTMGQFLREFPSSKNMSTGRNAFQNYGHAYGSRQGYVLTSTQK